jgi:tyrosine-protein phosphatase SIW14
MGWGTLWRGCLTVALVLLVLAPAPLWYRYRYVEAKRLRVVADGVLYRAGQMTAAGLREAIGRYEIRTVINLQHESPDPLLPEHWLGRGSIRESQLCAQLGVRYVVLTPDLLPPDNRLDQIPPAVEQFLEIMDDASELSSATPLSSGVAPYRSIDGDLSHGI